MAKFHRLAADRAAPEVADELARVALDLDRQPGLERLFALLRVDDAPAG